MHSKIKGKFRQARLDKDIFLKGVLGNLVAELGNEAKAEKVDILDDVKVIEIINKWIKRTNDLIKLLKDRPQALKEAEQELQVYKSLLPEQLTEFEIIEAINKASLNSIPEVMKFFSSIYFGRYESREVIKIFNSLEV